MNVGLLSDTHGDPAAWEKAMGVLGTCDLVIHAGDVLYHGVFNPIVATYDPKGLADLLNGFQTPMMHARGNCDSEVDQLALDNHILSDFAFASVEGARILITHGHLYSDEELLKMASRGKADLVVKGHTHVPEVKMKEGVTLVNPGSCSLPKQEGRWPSAGKFQDGMITIYNIETGEAFLREEIPVR